MCNQFLNTIKILHIEVLWQMLYNIKESVEMLEKHSGNAERNEDLKRFYKFLKSLNECKWKALMLSQEIEKRLF